MLAVRKKKGDRKIYYARYFLQRARLINAITEVSGEISSLLLYTSHSQSGKTWPAWSRGKGDGWGQSLSYEGIRTRVISSAKDFRAYMIALHK